MFFNEHGRDEVRLNPNAITQAGKIPYVIRRYHKAVGLLSLVNMAVAATAYAVKKGYVPVIDMKNYPNMYLYPDEVGHVNTWEYYFEQPGGISLEEALSSRKYILSRDSNLFDNAEYDMQIFPEDLKNLDRWRGVYKRFLRFKPEVTARLERMTELYGGRKILGLPVRGTDYAHLKPKGHPIPPTAEQAIEKAREAMSERGFDSVYLATEDKKIAAKFQEAFGDKLILPEADYLDYDYEHPKSLASINGKRENDKYLRGLEYLVSMLFLSKCAGFISSKTSGAIGTMCMSEGFEYIYIFDLGVYP